MSQPTKALSRSWIPYPLDESPAIITNEDIQTVNGRLVSPGGHGLEGTANAGDLQSSLSRLSNNQYDEGSLAFSSVQAGLDDAFQVRGILFLTLREI